MLPAPTLHDESQNPKTWRVGSLTYTFPNLLNVFFWMLWGDFCLNLMDSGVQPNVIPIQLKKYGASMSQIGFLTGTVVEIMSIIMVAVISTWSDRHRGRLGRRIPFMLYATPPIAICLIALGFSPQIAGWLQHVFPGLFGKIAISSMVIGVIATTMVGYKFFDLFPQSVYYYLFADVIPQNVMGTFTSLFRLCATAGNLVFSWFLLKHAEDNPGLICVLAGGLYLISFLMMAVMVKEGKYPPPEPIEEGPDIARLLDTVRKYVRECYAIPYYWKFYLFSFCYMVGLQGFARFLVFYGRDISGGLGPFGKITSVALLVQMGVFFLVGPLIDRVHPIRAALAGFALMTVMAAASFLFVHGLWSFAALIIITYASIAVLQGAYLALLPRLLPRSHYGQFCSANAVLWHFGLMVLLPLCGHLLDVMGNRWIFAWLSAFSLVGFLALCWVYASWQRLGGDDQYQPPPPVPEPGRGFEVIMGDADRAADAT